MTLIAWDRMRRVPTFEPLASPFRQLLRERHEWRASWPGSATRGLQAVVDWYAPIGPGGEPIAFEEDPCRTSFAELEERHGEAPSFYRTLAWGVFLGGSLADATVKERAVQATPTTYADAADPPLLAIHGDADSMVPIEQSELLVNRLTEAGADASLVRVPGGDHPFRPEAGEISPAYLDPTVAFLQRMLGGRRRRQAGSATSIVPSTIRTG